MTTWTEVQRQDTDYNVLDEENDYVESGYVVAGYLSKTIWSPVALAETTWEPSS